MATLEKIARDVDHIKREILRMTPPEHFSKKDIVRSFFGAVFLGSTFILTKLLVDLAPKLTTGHIVALILSTILILTGEIYFIGYGRVQNKKNRPFGQFWLKRLTTFYLVAVVTSVFLAYVYGVNALVGAPVNVVKLVVAMSLPCAVGAALADLLKQY